MVALWYLHVEEKERNSIVKLQEAILVSTSDIKDIDIDPNKYKHMCSEKILTDTCLNTEIVLGHKTVTSLEQWENKCITEPDCWNLTDRGKQLVAIWELLALDHRYEKFGRVIDVLKESWEKMTGLEATFDDISRRNSQKVATNSVKLSPTLQKKASDFLHSVVANEKRSDSPSICSDHQVANSYEPLKSELGINNVENVSKNLLQLLGLNKRYANKIQLKEAIAINPDMTKISFKGEGCSSLQELPFLVLYKLMSYDVKCRSNLMTQVVIREGDKDDGDKDDGGNDDGDDDDGDNDDGEDDANDEEEEDEEKDNIKEEDYSEIEIFEKIKKLNQINAMDCLHALLLCCDDLLRQDLFSRLAKCQLSVPFLMPDPVKETLILPIWAMRSIIKEWTPHGQQLQSHSIITYLLPIISFIRLGQHKKIRISKSRILNLLISGSENSPFYSSGGQYPRVFSKGLVDMSWYIPSEACDKLENAIAFLNLHGDAHQYPLQIELLTRISSLCFVVITQKLNTQDEALLNSFNDSPCSLKILGSVNNPKKGFAKFKMISLNNKNDDEISKELREILNEKITEVKSKSLEEITTKLSNCCVEVDENSEELKLAFDSIQVIKEKVTSYHSDIQGLKDDMLPLQGADLWQEWAQNDKELYRQTNRRNLDVDVYSKQIDDTQEEIRKKQLLFVPSPSSLMKSFLDVLLQFSGDDSSIRQRNYFLQQLNLFLKEHYRHFMNSKEQQYLQLQTELNELSSGHLKKVKKKEFEEVHKEILDTTLGIEHLFREIAQIYEVASTYESHKKYCAELSSMMADLVIEGYPLELMDGVVKDVPLKWIKAVLNDVKKKLDNPKIFVMSVLGIQSSGKSTMLNAVFGLQFKVSAGQCTRGAFMQLIQLKFNREPDSGYKYIFIVDTEGLQAPKDKIKDYTHDKELATFVIGLATTLINIMGEVSGNMDNVLQTSVHAFLRMTKVKNKRSCQFVHQNTSASSKSSAGHKKFTQNLDRFTKEAAKAENCSGIYECFNDVIRYHDMKDAHHFPALWKGNPPMAPVNDEYSKKAQYLKHHIISSISECEESSFQALSSFMTHFSDLWNALLQEDFVYSFKNTLHVIAHNELVKQYLDCKYDFTKSMQDWMLTASNEIRGCKLDNVSATVQRKQDELQTLVWKQYTKMENKMKPIFEGEYKVICKNWESEFEDKMLKLTKTLQSEGNTFCMELSNTREKYQNLKRRKTILELKLQKM